MYIVNSPHLLIDIHVRKSPGGDLKVNLNASGATPAFDTKINPIIRHVNAFCVLTPSHVI